MLFYIKTQTFYITSYKMHNIKTNHVTQYWAYFEQLQYDSNIIVLFKKPFKFIYKSGNDNIELIQTKILIFINPIMKQNYF